jgi:hypothetical protein
MSQECQVQYDLCCGEINGYNIETQTGMFRLTVEIDPEGSGEVLGGGDIVAFSDATLEAFPAGGFQFVGYYDPYGNLLSDSEVFTFVLTGNTIIVARFEEVP